MSVRAASSHNTADQVTTSNGKQYVYTHSHNSLVFYSCKSHLRIDLAHDATVGERSMNFKKFPTLTQDLSMEMHRYERESESTYPCRSLSGKRLSNTVDVVERLLMIQITDVPRSNHDPSRSSTERTAPPRSTHVRLDDAFTSSIQRATVK